MFGAGDTPRQSHPKHPKDHRATCPRGPVPGLATAVEGSTGEGYLLDVLDGSG
jgi:hypothetical protein